MTFEEDTILPIPDLIVEARKQIGRVDKTHQASDGRRSFAFLGVKDAVEACRAVFDRLGIVPTLQLVSGTYQVNPIGNGNYLLFQALAEFDVVFKGPLNDELVYRVASAAVDERDKFSASLNSVAMREGIKAALLMYDGESNIEDNIERIPTANSSNGRRRPVAGNSGTGPKGSLTEPMALKSERVRLTEIVDRLAEETDTKKLEEVADALEILDIFEPGDEGTIRTRLPKSVFTAAMDVLHRYGYLEPNAKLATKEDRKLVSGMLKHAKKQNEKTFTEVVKPALAEIDLFTSNGQLRKKLTKDQYRAAMTRLAELGFDEPFETDTPEAKIAEIQIELDTKPDLPQIDDDLEDENGEPLTREKAEADLDETKQKALDAAMANIGGNITKGTAGIKGANK